METIDWDAMDKEQAANAPQYKDFCKTAGTYKVKVTGVDIKKVGPKESIAIEFKFEDDNYAYSKATHWYSVDNRKWSQLHMRNLMMVLGASKANAQTAVQSCEEKTNGNKDKICAVYKQVIERLIAKSPEVEIEMWFANSNDKYGKSDFTDRSVRMNRPEAKNDADPLDILSEGTEINQEEVLDNLPF